MQVKAPQPPSLDLADIDNGKQKTRAVSFPLIYEAQTVGLSSA
jgi:hypothetical protein